MSNDYILPPVPQSFFDEFGVGAAAKVMGYGHACAEHARAPLLERIAKLERSVIECANTGVRMMDAADQEIARLRADLAAKAGELKKYRADAERCHEYAIKTRLQAIRVHQICNLARIAYPEIGELADDGALHEAIHEVLRIEMPDGLFDAARKGEESDG